jgi:hypothetical protein
VRLSVKVTIFAIIATLTGYAYETVPRKSIIAGQTKGPDDESSIKQPDSAALATPVPRSATLGLLAQGVSGLVAWRRRDPREEQITVATWSTL